MFGMWKIKALKDNDSRNAARVAEVVSCMNEAIEGELYLPPYLRPNQCEIETDCVVIGFLDDVTGKGAAFCGLDKADYGYFLNTSLQIKENLSVVGKATIGDALTVEGEADLKADAKIGGDVNATGNVTGADCRVTIAGGSFEVPNPAWVDDGQGTSPDAQGNPKNITQTISGCVSSLANHTHTCAVGPTSTPVPVPLPAV